MYNTILKSKSEHKYINICHVVHDFPKKVYNIIRTLKILYISILPVYPFYPTIILPVYPFYSTIILPVYPFYPTIILPVYPFYPTIILPVYPFYPILDFYLFLKMGKRIYKLNFMLLRRGPTNKFTSWYLLK